MIVMILVKFVTAVIACTAWYYLPSASADGIGWFVYKPDASKTIQNAKLSRHLQKLKEEGKGVFYLES